MDATERKWESDMGKPSLDTFQDVQSLPTLPEQIAKVLDEVSRTTSMDYNLLHVIQYDPCIASRILAVANAPVYGYGGKVDSLQQAAGLLSPSLVNSLILTTPILELHRSRFRNLEKKLDCIESWIHSAVTSQLAGFLGTRAEKVEADVCLTSGLLMDIGKLAIKMYYPKEMFAAAKFSKQNQIPLDAVLHEQLGFSHHDVSAVLAQKWNYPESMVALLQSPESDQKGGSSTVGSVVLLAKLLAEEWGFGDGLGVPLTLPRWELMEKVGISQSDLSQWEDAMKRLAQQIAEILRVKKFS